jgi:hypothetical protein
MADQEINVKILGKINDLLSSVDAGKSKIAELADPVKSVTESFSGIASALAAAFAVDKIADFAREIGNLGNEILDASEITGIAAGKFQDLAFVAASSGNSMEDARQAIVKLDRSISEANNGNDGLIDAFQRIGVSIKDLKSASPDEIFKKVAEGFSKAENGAAKTALAIEIFGKSGATMIPILNKGADGIEEFTKKFESLGAKLSDGQLAVFNKLNESFVFMDTALAGIGQNIFSVFTPAVSAAINGITDLAAAFNQAATKDGNLLHESLIGVGSLLNTIVNTVDLCITGLRELGVVGVGVMDGLKIATRGWIDSWNALGTGSFSKAADVFAKSGNDAAAKIRSGFSEGEKLNSEFNSRANQRDSDLFNPLASSSGGGGKISSKSIGKSGGGKGSSGADDSLRLLQEKVRAEQESANQEYEIEKANLERKKELGQITHLEMLDGLRRFETEKFRAQNQSLISELNMLRNKPREQLKVNNQIEALQRKHTKAMLDIDTKSAVEHRRIWGSYAQPVTSAFGTAITGILQGTQTFQQAMLGVVDTLVSSFVSMAAKMMEEWLFAELFNEATSKTTALSSIGASAAEAGAGAFAAIAKINPPAAPAAGAAAYLGASAYASLLPAAEGVWNLPKDMPMQLHEGESVLPKKFAEGMRKGQGIGGGGANITINAVDAKSIQRLIKDNGGAVVQALVKQHRQFNSAIRGKG